MGYITNLVARLDMRILSNMMHYGARTALSPCSRRTWHKAQRCRRPRSSYQESYSQSLNGYSEWLDAVRQYDALSFHSVRPCHPMSDQSWQRYGRHNTGSRITSCSRSCSQAHQQNSSKGLYDTSDHYQQGGDRAESSANRSAHNPHGSVIIGDLIITVAGITSYIAILDASRFGLFCPRLGSAAADGSTTTGYDGAGKLFVRLSARSALDPD